MPTIPHMPRRSAVSVVAEVVREAFWVLSLGLIACYAFFAGLGAFSPADVGGVTALVGLLLVLWLVHAWAQSHRGEADRDPRVRSARERRGF